VVFEPGVTFDDLVVEDDDCAALSNEVFDGSAGVDCVFASSSGRCWLRHVVEVVMVVVRRRRRSSLVLRKGQGQAVESKV